MKPRTNPLSQVYARMKVYDPQGNEIGTVKQVYLGEPNDDAIAHGYVVGAPELRDDDPSMVEAVTGAFIHDEDEIPEELRERMLRYGYLLVDSIGIGASDRYVFPEQIEQVSETGVFLKA